MLQLPCHAGDTEPPVCHGRVGSTTRATCQARSLPVGQWSSLPALLCMVVAQPQRPLTEPQTSKGSRTRLLLPSGRSLLLGRALGDRQMSRQEVKGIPRAKSPCISCWPGREGRMVPRAPWTPAGKAPSVATRANSGPGQLLQRCVRWPRGLCAWQTPPSPGGLQRRPLRNPGLASRVPKEKISQLAPALKGVPSEALGQAAGSCRAGQHLGMTCNQEP